MLKELPEFAKRTQTSGDLKTRVAKERSTLKPILDELRSRFDNEIRQWRQVDPGDENVRVRAGFLRFLMLGGDEAAPVHERGVELSTAWIDGDLDLDGCEVNYPFSLKDCRSDGSLTLRFATTRAIDLGGSRINSITAIRAWIGSSAYLNNGFRANGSVSFRGARIDGNLEFDAGEFEEVDCVNATIAGDVFLSDATIEGDLDFDSAEATDVSAPNAKFGGCVSFRDTQVQWVNSTPDGKGVALNCDAVKIEGSAWLNQGFEARGKVRFVNARIGRDFYIAGSDGKGGGFSERSARKRGGEIAKADLRDGIGFGRTTGHRLPRPGALNSRGDSRSLEG